MPDHEGKVKDKIHDVKSLPSSSGSDDDKPVVVDKFKKMSYRVFDRHKPVHNVVGGGKFVDIILWKNKKTSGIVFGVGTAVWFLFEVMDYNFITFVSHTLIMSLASIFLWSNASIFINKTPPKIPEVTIPEICLLDAVSTLRTQLNQALVCLHKIGTGTDVKMFLVVNAGLWVISVIGKWCHFLTLIYIGFIWMFTVPLLYEKHKDKVDLYAEKAMVEVKKQYAIRAAKMSKGEPNKKKD